MTTITSDTEFLLKLYGLLSPSSLDPRAPKDLLEQATELLDYLAANDFIYNISDHIDSGGWAGIPALFDPTQPSGLAGQVTAEQAHTFLTPFLVSSLEDMTGRDPLLGLPPMVIGLSEGSSIVGTLGDDLVDGGAGDDTVWGLDGNDILHAGTGTNHLFGGTGDDTYILASPDDLTSEAEDAGFDTLLASFDINLTERGMHFEAASLTGTAHANIIGNSRDNLQIGNTGDNALSGMGGTDSLFGGAGHDILDGGTGTDHLFGGLDNDTYILDQAFDSTRGEVGYAQGGGIDTVRALFDGHTLATNIEILRLGSGTDNWSGTGNDAFNTLVGNAGGNALNGRGGNDHIIGHAGNDTLTGGEGADTLVGGAGADTFVYTSISNSRAGTGARDTINGFTHGTDRIDLAAIDANTNSFGHDDPFAFIGTRGFDGTAGQLRSQSLGGADAILVEGDINGDATADFHILILGTTWMTGTDFAL